LRHVLRLPEESAKRTSSNNISFRPEAGRTFVTRCQRRAAPADYTAVPRLISPRIAFFYAAIFLVIGVQLPFWPVWLAARSLGAVEIGALMAIGQWLR